MADTQDPQFDRKLNQHYLTELATARAHAEPLPGPLADAFGEDSVVVETTTGQKVRVRKLVFSDFVLLRKLDSPLHRQILEVSKPQGLREATDFTDEDSVEMAFQFTRPVAEVRALLNKGREVFREGALAAIGDQYDGITLSRIVAAVEQQLTRSFETAIKYAPAQEDESTVFTQGAPVSPQLEPAGV